MPFSDGLIIGAIVSAFAIFGIVQAWGDYQTRNLGRKAAEDTPAREQDIKKAA